MLTVREGPVITARMTSLGNRSTVSVSLLEHRTGCPVTLNIGIWLVDSHSLGMVNIVTGNLCETTLLCQIKCTHCVRADC